MKQIIRLTHPTVEPITTEEAKLHLRVNGADDDALIDALIAATRQYAEDLCNRPWVKATFALLLDSQPGTLIRIPTADLKSVGDITYKDSDHATQTVSTDDYEIDLERCVIRQINPWPLARDWRVEFTAGPDLEVSPPDPIPQTVIAGMKLLLGDLYENREAAVIGTIHTENPTADRLLFLSRIEMGV